MLCRSKVYKPYPSCLYRLFSSTFYKKTKISESRYLSSIIYFYVNSSFHYYCLLLLSSSPYCSFFYPFINKRKSPRQNKSAEGSCFFILLSHFSIISNTTFLTSGFSVYSITSSLNANIYWRNVFHSIPSAIHRQDIHHLDNAYQLFHC